MKKWEKSGDFGKLVKKFRIINSRTQEEVAESLECSDRQIRNIEAGKDTALSTAMLLCEEYGIELSELEKLLSPDDLYTVSKEINTLDGNNYIGYGIEGNGISFNDISVNFSDMQRFVTLCNCFKVEAIHMRDIIDDFLCAG